MTAKTYRLTIAILLLACVALAITTAYYAHDRGVLLELIRVYGLGG